MSDSRLRTLERRWKETGAAEDEAAYLIERMRVGGLSQERLLIAAQLGHQPSQQALHRKFRSWPAAFNEWISRAFETFCREVVVRSLYVLADKAGEFDQTHLTTTEVSIIKHDLIEWLRHSKTAEIDEETWAICYIGRVAGRELLTMAVMTARREPSNFTIVLQHLSELAEDMQHALVGHVTDYLISWSITGEDPLLEICSGEAEHWVGGLSLASGRQDAIRQYLNANLKFLTPEAKQYLEEEIRDYQELLGS